MSKLRKGDEVEVLTGKDRTKRGTIMRVLSKDNKVIVEGVNVVKKHVRPNPMKGITGGIVDRTMPIDQSNVMLFNPATSKGERVGFKVVDGNKVRVFKSSGALVGSKG